MVEFVGRRHRKRRSQNLYFLSGRNRMTFGDKIRSMADEELAVFLVLLLKREQEEVIEVISPAINAAGINFSVINIPAIDYAQQLEVLRQEV